MSSSSTAQNSPSCSRASGGRSDVLVYPKEIGRGVFLLHGSEADVVVAIRRPESGVTLVVHHEIRIGAAHVEWMHRFPVRLGPLRHRSCVLGIGVDTRNDHRPGRVPAVPGRIAFAYPMDGAVDRVEVHEGKL